ncbi:MAG: hypothetical protein F4Z95_11165 [Gammaproteobacteria bacterium]|nr:hypothetical protein [Gammaproteobacteria bacterium]
MIENDLDATKTSPNSPRKRTGPRAPRSIRFSDDEWNGIENAAEAHGMTVAELVRYAALKFSAGKIGPSSSPIPPETLAQIDRIYRGVYLLSTLKRDEMSRAGLQDKLEQVVHDARASQATMRKEASKLSA